MYIPQLIRWLCFKTLSHEIWTETPEIMKKPIRRVYLSPASFYSISFFLPALLILSCSTPFFGRFIFSTLGKFKITYYYGERKKKKMNDTKSVNRIITKAKVRRKRNCTEWVKTTTAVFTSFNPLMSAIFRHDIFTMLVLSLYIHIYQSFAHNTNRFFSIPFILWLLLPKLFSCNLLRLHTKNIFLLYLCGIGGSIVSFAYTIGESRVSTGMQRRKIRQGREWLLAKYHFYMFQKNM